MPPAALVRPKVSNTWRSTRVRRSPEPKCGAHDVWNRHGSDRDLRADLQAECRCEQAADAKPGHRRNRAGGYCNGGDEDVEQHTRVIDAIDSVLEHQ